MSTAVYVAAAGLVLAPALYMYMANMVRSSFPQLKNKRICLLIAHPDDEAMFFSPTILALTRPDTGNHVKILCLSTGNADGLGETRKKELVKSGMLLGLRDENDIFVLDNRDDFPDSMSKKWDEQKIASLLCSAVAPHLARQRSQADTAPQANIDVLITFDANGVSSHPNHTSLYHGARAFVTALVRGKSEFPCPVDLYTLTTVNILRKYISVYDVLNSLYLYATGVKHTSETHPETLLFMSSLFGDGASHGTAWKAMTEAHKSQMVWFRYGWITVSRYMVMNDLRLENPGGKLIE